MRSADRIAINVALARLSEIDDIHLGAMITPGAIVVPAALTHCGLAAGCRRRTTSRPRSSRATRR